MRKFALILAGALMIIGALVGTSDAEDYGDEAETCNYARVIIGCQRTRYLVDQLPEGPSFVDVIDGVRYECVNVGLDATWCVAGDSITIDPTPTQTATPTTTAVPTPVPTALVVVANPCEEGQILQRDETFGVVCVTVARAYAIDPSGVPAYTG